MLGSVRKNRNPFQKTWLPPNKKRRSQMLSHSFLALRWKDKKYLYMLSTKYSNINLVDIGKRK